MKVGFAVRFGRAYEWAAMLSPKARAEYKAWAEERQEQVKELSKLWVRRVDFTPTAMQVEVSSEILKAFVAATAIQMREQKAENYLNMILNDPITGHSFEYTIKRSEGMSPCEKLEKVEAERDRLLEEARVAKREAAHADDAQLDEIMEEIGQMLELGAYARCDAFFKGLLLSRLTDETLIGALTAALPEKLALEMPARTEVAALVRSRLVAKGVDADAALQGLE